VQKFDRGEAQADRREAGTSQSNGYSLGRPVPRRAE